MKLRIITTHDPKAVHYFLKDCARAKIDLDFADSIESFIEKFGTSQKYDGFLIHPEHEKYNSFMEQFEKKFPNARWAFVSTGLEDSITIVEGFPAFSCLDINGIKKYFTGTN